MATQKIGPSVWTRMGLELNALRSLITRIQSDREYTRAMNGMSGVLSAMSQEERSRNSVADGAIPDVPNASANAEIYALYRAGIVAGSDALGTYNPTSNIKRSEVAAIVHRFIDASQRKSITLSAPAAPAASSASDGDETGFVPTSWSWTAEGGEGYGLSDFTSGKYVREDGRAVLYIESSDSPDYFSYQLYSLADGSKSSAFKAPCADGGTYANYATAYLQSEASAVDSLEGLSFFALSRDQLSIATEWMEELYIAYGAPDGVYYLVREKG